MFLYLGELKYGIYPRYHLLCKKSRFEIVEDNELSKKCKATINELTYQLEHEFSDIKNFSIRKNSKGQIKEVLIKFKY